MEDLPEDLSSIQDAELRVMLWRRRILTTIELKELFRINELRAKIYRELKRRREEEEK